MNNFLDFVDTPPYPRSLYIKSLGIKERAIKNNFLSFGSYFPMLQGSLEQDNFTFSRYTPRCEVSTKVSTSMKEKILVRTPQLSLRESYKDSVDSFRFVVRNISNTLKIAFT